MTELLTEILMQPIIKNGNYETKDKNIIKYGIELMVTSFIGIFWMIIMSFVICKPTAWVFFLLGIAPIRTYAGGFHAKTHFRCYLISTVVFVVSLLVVKASVLGIKTIFFMELFAVVIIVLMAPMEANNKPLKAETKRKNRKKCLIIAFVGLIICACMIKNKYGLDKVALFCLGVFWAAISLIASKIEKQKRRCEKDA